MRCSETYFMPRSGNTVLSTSHPVIFFNVPGTLWPEARGIPFMWQKCSILSSYSKRLVHLIVPGMQMTAFIAFTAQMAPPCFQKFTSEAHKRHLQPEPTSQLLVACWNSRTPSPFFLDWRVWFASNLSELTYPLVTTRGIPYNVIKSVINME